tara:strand:- start:339 stop:506 length:168 start_codon:yes stop_codon:yes gene_type:complete
MKIYDILELIQDKSKIIGHFLGGCIISGIGASILVRGTFVVLKDVVNIVDSCVLT